jgi:erythromycin esterase-like protein
MANPSSAELTLTTLDRVSHPLRGTHDDYDELLKMVAGRSIVMIGETSHGTHEFYRERGRITKRLIDELGFNAVTIEGDWPDAYLVNRYVTGTDETGDARSALGGFTRFPNWMWRNLDVVSFLQWLRAHNDAFTDWEHKVRFYGLDLYSLRTSIEWVVTYLDAVDPRAAREARERYACFDHVAREGQTYGYALARGALDPCEDQVVEQLLELRRHGDAYLRRDGVLAQDEQFCAEQNATLVHDAEEYYRQMFRAEVSSWNLRDLHMANTLDAIVHHLGRSGSAAKVVVWAHNSHVGDARATDLGRRGELNIGQLARQRYPHDTALLGFTTFSGQVTAASQWGGDAERKRVRDALDGSHESLLHRTARDNFWIATGDVAQDPLLSQERFARAIGVIYRPESERQSHYLRTNLTRQFDVVIHLDHTSALEPLDRTTSWDAGEPAETYPSGL